MATEAFVADIRIFAFGFPPKNWALCNGQLLPIAQNQALFSLPGTTYGGNGTTTFALPNMQGNSPVNQGQGPGLSSYNVGQAGGEVNHTLSLAETPGHTHTFTADPVTATAPNPGGALFGKYPGRGSGSPYYATSSTPVAMANNAVLPNTGGGQPHANQQVYLTVNFIIALQGVFPQRQ